MNNIITIGTWNISEGISAVWNLNEGIKELKNYKETELIKEIIQKINNYDFDVLCFQEFPIEIEGKTTLKDYIIKNSKLKYCITMPTSPTFLLKDGKSGVAVFSKHNIIESEKIYFNNPNITKTGKDGKKYISYDKGIIFSKINFNNKNINIINGHAIAFGPFNKNPEDFPKSYEPLEKLILKNCDDIPLIACGDFNTKSLFNIIPKIKGKVKDVIEGKTTPDYIENNANKKGEKLDYILLNSKIKVDTIKKIENLSDHYLCIAKLIL